MLHRTNVYRCLRLAAFVIATFGPHVSANGVVFDVVAQLHRPSAGNLTSIENSVSINDDGSVAFVASDSGGPGIYFHNGTSLTEIATDSSFSYGREIQLNNNNQVGAIRIRGGTRTANIWDANSEDTLTRIAGASIATPRPTGFFAGLGDYTSITNDGKLSFAGLNEFTTWKVYLSDSFVNNNSTPITTFANDTIFRPMAANNNLLVIGSRQGSNKAITFFDGTSDHEIATTASGQYTDLSLRPGISDDGQVITFYGNLTASGAQQINAGQPEVDPVSVGPGIFASVQINGGRRLLQLAGLSNNNVLDPGDSWNDLDANGLVDANEDVNGFTAFDTTTRIGVNQSQDEAYRFAFLGTGTGGLRGLYTGRISVDGGPEIQATATPVAQVQQNVPDLNGLLTDFAVHDFVNSNDQLAFWTTTGQTDAIVRATRILDPLRQFHSPFGQRLYAENRLPEFIERLETAAPGINPADIDELDNLRSIRDRNAYNLARRGCLVSSYAMALKLLENANGDPLADLTPAELNDLLTQNGGFNEISRIARRESDGTVITGSGDIPVFIGADLQHDELIRNTLFPSLRNREVRGTGADVLTEVRMALGNGEAALLNVRNGGHWVIATAVDNTDNITIVDPGSSFHDGSYANLNEIQTTFGNLRKARIVSVNDNPTAVLQTESPIEVVITSPSGARLGYDPLQGIEFDEIADSSYAEEFPILEPDTSYTVDEISGIEPFVPHIAFLNTVESGSYSIEVFGVENGDFKVHFDVIGAGAAQSFSESETISMGESMMFSFEVSVGSIPGDFDGDGDVDGNDFLMWQRGEVSDPPSADDLTLWQTQFGTTSLATTTIPEPATLLLAIFGLSAIGIRRRRFGK